MRGLKPTMEIYDELSGHPLILVPAPLDPKMLCVGVKGPNKTVIYYNENRDIPDVQTSKT